MSEIHSGRIDESKIDTVLAEEISFEGEVSFSEPLMIKGLFSGSINATKNTEGKKDAGALYIGKDAVVHAEIKALSVVVLGKVKGNITAVSKIELQSTAEVVGNIIAPQIVMESGCLFDGNSRTKAVDEAINEE